MAKKMEEKIKLFSMLSFVYNGKKKPDKKSDDNIAIESDEEFDSNVEKILAVYDGDASDENIDPELKKILLDVSAEENEEEAESQPEVNGDGMDDIEAGRPYYFDKVEEEDKKDLEMEADIYG